MPPFDIRKAWAPITVAVAHVPIADFALQSAKAFPQQDTKASWIFGFAEAYGPERTGRPGDESPGLPVFQR